MKFGVGVIGATGYIGTPYRSEIRESTDDATIVALCARRMDRLQAAAKEDGATVVTDDWRKVVEHPDVNFVVVATPDALHHEAVIACAENGKHLLCEKPIATDARQAHEMWQAYEKSGLGHFVPYWTRYVDMFARARQMVADGELGEIKAVIYRWHNPRPIDIPFTWRDDASLSAAGSIADVGSHAYDTVRWLIGQEATRVLAQADVVSPAKSDLGNIDLNEALELGRASSTTGGDKLRKATAFDYANIAWEFQNGAVGTIVLSHAPYLRKGLAPELELHGTRASMSIDRLTGVLTEVRPDEPAQVVDTLPHDGFGNRFAQHVFPAIRQRAAESESEHPGLDDGYRAQLFTDAAAASAKRGSWVDLAEFEVS